jgi:hypothetical protein
MFEYLARDRRRLRRGTRAFARAVELGEACVFVDHGFQWDGSNNVWLTRARASFVLEAGPEFDVRPRSLLNRMLGVGWRRSPIDPYFDEFFAVRTSWPDEAWHALTTRARTLLVGSFDDARLISDGRHVTLWREADFGREADAEAAAELVAEVVSYQSAVLEHLRRLPGASYVPASGTWNERNPPHVSFAGPVPIRIGPTAFGHRPVIAVSAACGRATTPFTVQLAADRDASDPGDLALVSGVLDAARELGADTLRCDGHRVTLFWGGLETGRERLLSAASLVGSFASGQLGGLYR